MFITNIQFINIMENNEFVSNPYKKEEKKSLAEVIISQIDVCRKEFSKEMKPGFNQKIFFNGEWIIVTHPDQRQTNIAVTKTLYNLLQWFFDDKFKEEYKKFQILIKNSNELFLNKYIELEMNSNLKRLAEETKKIPSHKLSKLSGEIRQSHLNYIAELYRELFSELVLLFKRKNELSGKRTLGWKD